jgi:hypothetical protein
MFPDAEVKNKSSAKTVVAGVAPPLFMLKKQVCEFAGAYTGVSLNRMASVPCFHFVRLAVFAHKAPTDRRGQRLHL